MLITNSLSLYSLCLGNVTVEKEAIGQDILAAAIAARNNGGIVICQVRKTKYMTSNNHLPFVYFE